MENKIKFGIVLILAAVCIGGFFIWQNLQREPDAPVPQQKEELSPGSVTSSAIIATAEPAVATESVPDPAIDESKEDMVIDINPDIIAFMAVTDEELVRELRIYANSCGYAAAEKVKDMDEMMVDYAKKTITVPCYFTLVKKISKFDLIYQYEKKEYRFVPW